MNDVLREEPALDVGTLRRAIQEEYAEVVELLLYGVLGSSPRNVSDLAHRGMPTTP